MIDSCVPFIDCITQFRYPKIRQFLICKAVIPKPITRCLVVTLFIVLGPREPNTAILAVCRFMARFAPRFPISCVFRDCSFSVEHHRLASFICKLVILPGLSKVHVPIFIHFLCFLLRLQQSTCNSSIVNIMRKDII